MTSDPISTYIKSMQSKGAVAVDLMRPGAENPGDNFNQREFDLILPEEVKTLWRHFDGMNSEDATVDQLWLDGSFYFFSEREALDDYQLCQDHWEQDPKFCNYWPKGYLPIGSPGDGSRLLINCVADSVTYGHIYELFYGIGVSRATPSLFDYFILAQKWLEAEAIWVDNDKIIERDFKKSSVIAAALFPTAENWTN